MSRRRRHLRDWDKARGILLAILGIVLIAGLGAAWYWTSRQPRLDAATGCPSTGPTAIHAILIDRSDPITPLQAQQVRQIIDRSVNAAKIGERFELYVANSDAVNALTPVASVCNPGRGNQANELYQNPHMIQRQFEEKFLKVLNQSLDSLLKASTTDSSPILESIRAVAVAAFGNVQAGTIPLQLTIVSDFVQHSAANSHFRGETNFVELSHRPAWRSLQANLKGASIHALYVLRADAKRNGVPIQNQGHQDFWIRAFEADGGGQWDFTPL
jgi:hypothetical protein